MVRILDEPDDEDEDVECARNTESERTMARRELATAAIVAAMSILTGFLLWMGGREADPGVGFPQRQSREAATSAVEAHVAEEQVQGSQQPVPVSPGPSPASRELIQTTETLEILVVAKDTEAPVPEATVTVIDEEAYAAALAKERSTHGSPRSRELKAELAVTAITNAAGLAVLPYLQRRLVIEAKCGPLWGVAYTQAVPSKQVRVVVEQDLQLRILTLSALGSPEAGVPVSLRSRTGITYIAKTTVSDAVTGIAVFQHVQRRFELGPRTGWHVTWGFPSLPLLRVPVEERSVGGLPILATVPPNGALDLELQETAASPLPLDALTVRLEAFSGMPGEDRSTMVWAPEEWATRRPDERGHICVGWLGTGLWVTITVEMHGATVAVETVQGPSRDGQRVAHTIALAGRDALPRLTGRLLTAEGAPYRGTEAECRVVAEDGSVLERTLALAPDGLFGFVLGAGAPAVEVELRARVGDLVATCVREVPQPLVPGDNPLGDVKVCLGELIASGKVTDRMAAPVADAVLLALQPIGNGEWRAARVGGTYRTRRDGTFALYLPPERGDAPERWRIAVSRTGYVGVTAEVGHGTRDVAIVLGAGGGLAGSIECGAGFTVQDFEVCLEGKEGRRGIWIGRHGAFAAADLQEGTYALVVRGRHSSGNRELLRVEGLAVVAGQVCRDARIQRLRPGEGMENVRLIVTDAETGAPVRHALVGPATEEDDSCITDAEGIALWTGTKAPRRWMVRALGYLDEELAAEGPELKVALRKAARVRLMIDPGAAGPAPEGLEVGVQLRRNLSLRRSEEAALGGGRWWLEAGEKAVPLAPGKYVAEVVLRVKAGQRSIEEVLEDQPVEFMVRGEEGQRVWIPLTQERRKAIEARLRERLRER